MNIRCCYCHDEITIEGVPFTELCNAGWLLRPDLGREKWMCKKCVENTSLYERGLRDGRREEMKRWVEGMK